MGCVGEKSLCIKTHSPLLLMCFDRGLIRKTNPTRSFTEREFNTELVSQGLEELRRQKGRSDNAEISCVRKLPLPLWLKGQMEEAKARSTGGCVLGEPGPWGEGLSGRRWSNGGNTAKADGGRGVDMTAQTSLMLLSSCLPPTPSLPKARGKEVWKMGFPVMHIRA